MSGSYTIAKAAPRLRQTTIFTETMTRVTVDTRMWVFALFIRIQFRKHT